MGEENQCISLADRVGELADRIGPVDPAYVDAFESDAEVVPPGPMTSGPQRLTFLVPFDSTVVNLGQSVTPQTKTHCLLGIDTGIGGRTALHVDFQATGEAATTENLGIPMTAPSSIERDAVPRTVTGYGMATADIAYHEAGGQHYVVTKEGDVIVRAASGRSAVLNAKAGPVEVVAGNDVAITATHNLRISAGGFTPTSPARAASWTTSAFASSSAYATEIGGAIMGFIGSFAGAVLATVPPVKVAKPMTTGTGSSTMPSDAFGGTLAVLGALCSISWNGITIHGRGDATIGAGRHASLWGNASAGIVSGLVAGLFGACADVKGFLFAGIVGGKDASLAAIGKCAVVGKKVVEGYAKKEVQITSRRGVNIEGTEVHLTSPKEVALFAPSGDTFVLGGNWGMQLSGVEALIGKFSGAPTCGRASFLEASPHFRVHASDTRIARKNGPPWICLNHDGAKMENDRGSFVRVDDTCQLFVQSNGKLVTMKG